MQFGSCGCRIREAGSGNVKKEKHEVSIIRSSAAEYLTFVASTGDSKESIEMRYEDENIWLTQRMMAVLYDVSKQTISQHIKRIYADGELMPEATVKKYLTVQTEGERQISRNQDHYNLQMIIAVGFKVNNERAVQFRKWANSIVKDYTIQGWAMDVERLKNSGSILTKEYFEKQLEKIREIRLSERKFYQKITDIYATAVDYDPSAKATQRFFAAVQNKLHYSIHGQTAAEVIYSRADAQKEYMGLTSWDGSPKSKIHSYDVTVELSDRQRIASARTNRFRLSRHGRDAGRTSYSHDDGGLGAAAQQLSHGVGQRDFAGCRKGIRRACQSTCIERVRKIPHRTGQIVSE